MNTSSVRAGALLAGVGVICAIPAGASGQVDPGKLGNTVNGVTKQVPQVAPQVQNQVPSVPKLGSSGTPSAQPKSSAPQSSGGGGGAGGGGGGGYSSGSTSGSGSASGSHVASGSSGASASSHGGGSGSPRAHAASSKHAKAGRSRVSGQKQAHATSKHAAKVAGADVGNQVRPATGVTGDSKLPFTGYALIVIAALGLMALASGAGLHTLSRLRMSRRRA